MFEDGRIESNLDFAPCMQLANGHKICIYMN